jgi:hypothetical protein
MIPIQDPNARLFDPAVRRIPVGYQDAEDAYNVQHRPTLHPFTDLSAPLTRWTRTWAIYQTSSHALPARASTDLSIDRVKSR